MADDNAFTINKLGLAGHAFPLSFTTTLAPTGSWVLWLVACDVAHIADLIVARSRSRHYVWELGHIMSKPNDYTDLLDVEEVAKEKGVECLAYDIGWASRGNPKKGSCDLICIAASDLPTLLHDISLYDFSMADAEAELSAEQIDELILLDHTTSAEPGQSLLDQIPWASLVVYNHDACYLTVQSRTSEIIRDVLARVVAMFTDVVGRAGGQGNTEPPPVGVTDRLMEPGSSWTAAQGMTTTGSDGVQLAFAASPWNLGDEVPTSADHVLNYSSVTRAWNWEPRAEA